MPKRPKPDPVPQWVINLYHFQPQFPGDGFNHTFAPDKPMPCEESFQITCPCHIKLVIGCNAVRQYGDADVITCPQCGSWHSILWHPPKRMGHPRSSISY